MLVIKTALMLLYPRRMRFNRYQIDYLVGIVYGLLITQLRDAKDQSGQHDSVKKSKSSQSTVAVRLAWLARDFAGLWRRGDAV